MKKAQFGAIVRKAIKAGKKAPITPKNAKPVKRALSSERLAGKQGTKLKDAMSKVNKKEMKMQVALNNPELNDNIYKYNDAHTKISKRMVGAALSVPVIGAGLSIRAAQKDKAVKAKAKAKVAAEKAKVKAKTSGKYKFEDGGQLPEAQLGTIIKTAIKGSKPAVKKLKGALTPDKGGYNPFKTKSQRRKAAVKDAALIAGYGSIPVAIGVNNLAEHKQKKARAKAKVASEKQKLRVKSAGSYTFAKGGVKKK